MADALPKMKALARLVLDETAQKSAESQAAARQLARMVLKLEDSVPAGGNKRARSSKQTVADWVDGVTKEYQDNRSTVRLTCVLCGRPIKAGQNFGSFRHAAVHLACLVGVAP